MEHLKSNFSSYDGIIAIKSSYTNCIKRLPIIQFGNKLILLIILFSQLNVNSQTCPNLPTPITGSAISAACGSTTNTTIQSGDVLSIDLNGGIEYTFEVCYNSVYDQPDVVNSQIQLWTSTMVFIEEATGNAANCSTIAYIACSDETVLLQAFSHSCISNWKKWDLNIKSKCCAITCQETVFATASSSSCTTESFDVAAPTFNSVCDEATISFTTDLPSGATSSLPNFITVSAGNPVGNYEIIWEIEDCFGVVKTCTQNVIVDPVLACDDLVLINLTGEKAEVTLATVLEGVAIACYSDYELKVFYQGIDVNNMVCCEHIGETLTYTVTHLSSGLICNGEIGVEDKFAPLISCEDMTIKCTQSTEPDSIGYPTVVENCDTTVNLEHFDSFENFNCADPNYIARITRTWIATDAAGFNNTCTQVINILRADLAGVILPADVIIECKDAVSNMEDSGEPLYCDLPISHYCNLVSYTKDDTTFVCENSYKIHRQWTVLDWCSGGTKESTQIIEVVDNTPPILVCPEDITIGTVVDLECAGTVTLPSIESARDVCTAEPTVEPVWEFGIGFGPFNNVPVGVHSVDYVVTDACGNSSTCSINVTVEDDDRPTAICDLFTQISIPSIGSALICADDIDTGSHDNCGVQSIELSLMSDTTFMNCLEFDCNDAGTTEMIILRVFDEAGLYNDCMVEVEIVDKVAPFLNCPADITLNCIEDETDIDLTGLATATDPCLDSIYFEDDNQLTTCRTGVVIRTWFATDDFGNISSCDQTITLVDNTPPSITFGRDTTLTCESLSNDYGRPVVEDDCGIYAAGFVDDFLINNECEQKVLRTWTVINDCTEEEFADVILIKIFNDEGLPQFFGAPMEIVVSCEDPSPDFIEPLITDDCDVDLQIEITMGVEPVPLCTGEAVRFKTWKATDACGNVGEFTQTISVVDDTPPLFANLPGNLDLNCDDPIPDLNPIVTDNCDNDIEFELVVTETIGACSQEFSIERVWTATDNCGNVSQVSQFIMVSDNDPPFFTDIPADITLDCTDEIPNLIPSFGDACDGDVILTASEVRIDGDCPDEEEIVRTFIIEDGCNNKDTLVTSILILDNSPPTFDPTSFDPNPVISCDQPLPNVSAGVSDNCDPAPIIEISIDSTGTVCERIITRTITATDRCGNSTEIKQVITSEDNTAPTVLFRPPFLIVSDTTICVTNIQVEPILFQDNCNDDLNVFFEIDYNSDGYNGFIFDAGLSFNDTLIQGTNASGEYPIGNHTVTYTATDVCGNSTEEVLRIEVTERKFPLIGCVSNEFFIGPDGTVTVNTSQVINPEVTFDECTPIDVQFADDFLGTNLLGHSLTFGCDDSGLNLAFVVAVDSFGNTSACLNQIEISDPNGNCSGNGGSNRPDYIVAGRITDEEMKAMAGVNVNLGVNQINTTSTGEHGLYHFLEVLPGDNCTVIPEKNENYLAGVTTFDLVIIQRHIIGALELDSPYKMIAADVNRSGTISTLDLVQLRQLILFQTTEFQNNNSWIFIPADFNFTDERNPFLDEFPEKYTCFNIESSALNVNFIAIKVGDVNCSAGSQLQGEGLNKRRPEPTVHLALANERLEAGKTYNVPVMLETVEELSALQFSLKLDDGLILEGVSIDESCSNCVHLDKEQNLIHFAWTSFDEQNSSLFYLKVKANKDLDLLDKISYSTEYIEAMAYNDSGTELHLGLKDNDTLNISEVDIQSFEGFNVLQNNPNPFRHETTIRIQSDEATNVFLTVINANGQTVLDQEYSLTEGESFISFQRKSLPSGVYFYKIKSATKEITKKMMILDF